MSDRTKEIIAELESIKIPSDSDRLKAIETQVKVIYGILEENCDLHQAADQRITNINNAALEIVSLIREQESRFYPALLEIENLKKKVNSLEEDLRFLTITIHKLEGD